MLSAILDTVTADFYGAGGGTTVVGGFIAVITFFRGLIDIAVTAAWRFARAGARVGIDRIAIIALLSAILDAVTADFYGAGGRAAVVGGFIAVITFFRGLIDETVTAAWR